MKREFLSFEQARQYARSLKLKSSKEWVKITKSDEFPENIPKRPEGTYKDKGWRGYSDWLGTGHGGYVQKDKGRMSFEQARQYVRKLKLNGLNGWIAYCKSGKRPINIPASPHTSYKKEGWAGYGDWTGSGRVRSISFLSFEQARQYVRKLKFKNSDEYRSWSTSKKRPSNIPSQPERTYSNEWKGWNDYLQESSIQLDEEFDLSDNEKLSSSLDDAIKNIKTKYLPYKQARAYVQKLGLKGQKDWFRFAKSDKKPEFIPHSPYQYYKEWSGFADWLGTKRIRPTNFTTFEKTREFARKLNLKSQLEWEKFAQSGNKPDIIPAKPDDVYEKSAEWTNWADFLGFTPAQGGRSIFVRRVRTRHQELKELGLTTEQIITKVSQEFPYISKDEVKTKIKELSTES